MATHTPLSRSALTIDYDAFSQFTQHGHLNREGILIYVEATILNREASVPDTIVNHLSECKECAKQAKCLFELWKKIGGNGRSITLPYFQEQAFISPANDWQQPCPRQY